VRRLGGAVAGFGEDGGVDRVTGDSRHAKFGTLRDVGDVSARGGRAGRDGGSAVAVVDEASGIVKGDRGRVDGRGDTGRRERHFLKKKSWSDVRGDMRLAGERRQG